MRKQSIWLLISFAVFCLLLLANPFALEAKAQKAVACAALMVMLWVSEALPMPVVALMPLVLFPLLGIADTAETAAPFANPVIFLFM
ncbi:MAG TPA: anion permease, partial [Phnomibacter sp.]|nr:anion permease [Phnomibacter sp.]